MQTEVTTNKRHLSRRALLTMGAGAILAGIVAATTGAKAAEPAEIGYMKPGEAHKAALAGEIILIDIRRPDEWLGTNVAEGAVGLDMRADDFVPTLVALRQANPDTPIALICRTGNRTEYVTTALAKQGFPGLVDVREGMVGGRHGKGWLKRGLPTYAGTPENMVVHRAALLP